MSALLALSLFFAVPFQKEDAMKVTMEQIHASFRADIFGGEVRETARILHTHSDFARFLSDPELFFDGRFAFYERYETGDFFARSDLLAVVALGDRELVSCERQEGKWRVTLKGTKGDARLYLITVEKSDADGVEIVTV